VNPGKGNQAHVSTVPRDEERLDEASTSDEAARILDVVAEILGERGYNALQLRHVASRAQVSLSTISGHFSSKDELVIAAVGRWMHERVYAELPSPDADASLEEALTCWYRQFLSPWEREPAMLRVFLRATLLPGGQQLSLEGAETVLPQTQQMFDGYDRDFVADVNLIISNVLYGLLGQFNNRQIDMPYMITVIERTIRRLTADACKQQA